MASNYWSVPASREDRRAPSASRDPRTRTAGYDMSDPFEALCPAGCVPEWRDGTWVHERSCLLRSRALGGGGGAGASGQRRSS